MRIAELLLDGVWAGPDLDGAVQAAGPGDLAEALALAAHPDAGVRLSLARALSSLTDLEPPAPAVVETAVTMTTDPEAGVRDWACFALGQQWRELDSPAVRDALAVRLDDDDRDTRCEALVGLALRRDLRALPVVREALARPDGQLRRLELVAAGALADPSLHELVARHLDGWDDDDALVVEAVRRLTDPAGTGDDLVAGVAQLSRDRARGLPDDPECLRAWRALDAVLDLRPERAQAAYDDVLALLADDPAAAEELRRDSALAVLAGRLDVP